MTSVQVPVNDIASSPACAPRPAQPRLFPWIQGLRAAAALAVAFAHVANDAITGGQDSHGAIAAMFHAMPWAGGVDVFFVISGFVIVHASAGLFGRSGGALMFLRRRLTRIVPLYWVLTTLFLLTSVIGASAIHGEMGGAGYIFASYLFFPWPRPDGLMEPALGLGWTLNFECFFYMLLTPCILLTRNWAVMVGTMALCGLVAAGQIVGFTAAALRFWSDPIVLEFVLGMGIALAVSRGLRLSGWLRLVLVAVAVVALHAQANTPIGWRVFGFGVPGALLVIAAVSSRGDGRNGLIMRAMVRLGDASFAMYLFHPFVMRGFTLVYARIGAHSQTSGMATVLLSLIVAQLCALAINITFEQRVMAMLRQK